MNGGLRDSQTMCDLNRTEPLRVKLSYLAPDLCHRTYVRTLPGRKGGTCCAIVAVGTMGLSTR